MPHFGICLVITISMARKYERTDPNEVLSAKDEGLALLKMVLSWSTYNRSNKSVFWWWFDSEERSWAEIAFTIHWNVCKFELLYFRNYSSHNSQYSGPRKNAIDGSFRQAMQIWTGFAKLGHFAEALHEWIFSEVALMRYSEAKKHNF